MPTPRRVPRRLNHEPEAVRWARERAGLNQTQLAERAGLARTLVVEIEGGTRNATPENLIKLAEAMNCPIVALERKREPETTPRSDGQVPLVRGGERAGQQGADADELLEVRSEAVERTAS